MRFGLPPWLIMGPALAGSVLVGAAMTLSVQLGLATAVALCYVPLALLNLPLAIVVWLPTTSLIAVSALDVGPNLAGITILLAWTGALAARGSRVRRLIAEHARLLIAVGALLLWILLSTAWAREPPVGGGIFFGWIAVGAIVLVISTTLTESRYLRLGIAAFVAGVVISVALGVLGGAVQAPSDPSLDTSARVVGGSGDPNFLAAGIVPAIVLAAGLAVGSPRLIVRLAALATVMFLTVGLLETASRGGFAAAIVGAVVILVLAKRHRAWMVALLLCIVGIAVAWFSADPSAWERLSDVSDSSGRTELWGVAWQMWQDHPIAGVGLEAFRDNAAGYVRELGSLEYAEFITEQPKVVHNTYLQLLAEGGIVGLLLLIGVIAAALRATWQAISLFEAEGNAAMAVLARSVIAALVVMLASATFLSAATDRRFWVLLALGPALLACARHEARADSTAVAPHAARSHTRRPRRSARAPALGTGAANAVSGRPITY